MRFSSTHKFATYFAVAAATAALLLSPDVDTVTAVLAVLGISASWFVDPPRLSGRPLALAWNIATLAFLGFLVVQVLRGGSLISAGVHFLLFVLINKLFNRRTSKDYQQIYVLSFLMLVAATTLNTSLTFAICFVLYVVAVTWSLMLFHLRREMEDNYLLKHSEGAQSKKVEVERILNSRRIVGGKFLAGTALVSLGVLAGTGTVFAFFPRIGFGLFAAHRRHGVAMAGFSERVQLGQHGTIRDNPRVVMRVAFGPPGRRRETPPPPLHWRGALYEHYQRGEWSHGDELVGRSTAVPPVDRLYRFNYAPGLPLSASTADVRRLLRQEIYLEPLESTLFFAADRPVALEQPAPVFGGRPPFVPRRGPHGEIRGTRVRTAGVHFTAYSKVYAPNPDVLRRAKPITDHRWSRFLQLPSDLPPRVLALARRLTRDRPTIFGKVLAVQRHLRRRYRYTLRLTHDPRLDPVDEFLFVTKRGHCEYFASAMALLLRAVGIHTRHVNGFYGGQWNRYGHYLAVRQGDAHAWTEVLFSNVGWVTFDPTPSRGGGAAGGVLERLRELIDAIRLRWFSYVVEYDLDKQMQFLARVKRAVDKPAERGTGGGWLARNRRGVLLGAAALLALALLGWRWRRRRGARGGDARSPRAAHPATRRYQQALTALARSGQVKPSATTPAEFAESLAHQEHPCAELVAQLTRCYYVARFGGDRGAAGDDAQLLALVQHLKQRLSATASRPHRGA